MYYEPDDTPDIDVAPRHRLAGRCAECWTSFGHAPGCPNDDPDREEADADNTQH